MNGVRAIIPRAVGAYRRRVTARGAILIYHRIAEERIDPWGLCVTPTHFAQQLETLRKLGYRLVPVARLAEELTSGHLPRRTVAVSFDDGYYDNLEHARPLLEKYEVPATVFATAGYIARDSEFWWDVLDRVFLQPNELPDVLELATEGRTMAWDLGAEAKLSASCAERWPHRRPLREATTERHRIHDQLWRVLLAAAPEERARLAALLLDWAELPPAESSRRRPLDQDELRRLGRDDLVEIGSHSLTHPALAELPPEGQAHELSASKAILEKILGRPVLGCSFPHGRATPQTEDAARHSGYLYACGSSPIALTRRTDCYHLPRVSAANLDGERFSAFIRGHVAA